ncbi:MAG: YebC/PmpR family DNA-binding transcriptional regulator [Candidatus Paceibacterota bacterium]
MAGHSHWSSVKHKKGVIDQKRGQLFSKLLKAITIAARQEPNPQFNFQLRTAIEKAKENNVPQDNIERAIKRASEAGENLEELIIEAYGPEGIAILIEAATDNKNRTIAEVKKILNEQNAKWADPGSVQWAFENKDGEWRAKFKQEVSGETKQKIQILIQALEKRDDVQKVHTNL